MVYHLIFDNYPSCSFHRDCYEGDNNTLHSVTDQYRMNDECNLYNLIQSFGHRHTNGRVDRSQAGLTAGHTRCLDSEHDCCYFPIDCNIAVKSELSYSQYSSSHRFIINSRASGTHHSSINTGITQYDETGEMCPTMDDFIDSYYNKQKENYFDIFIINVLSYFLITIVIYLYYNTYNTKKEQEGMTFKKVITVESV